MHSTSVNRRTHFRLWLSMLQCAVTDAGVTPAGSVSRSGSAGVEEATGSDFLALARPSDPSNPQYDASVHAAVGIASRNPSESTGAKDGAARPGEEPSDVFFDCDEEFTSA